MKISTIHNRKARKKWLICPALASVLALLLVLSSLPVYAGEQQTEQTETPTVTQDAGSESAESAASSEQDELVADKLEPMQPNDPQEPEVAANDNWENIEPYISILLHEGYIGFKNKSSRNYLTIPNGSTSAGTNVCQQSEKNIANAQEFFLSYTYTPTKNVAYFTIYPVDSSGNTVSTRVKSSVNANEGVANVSLQNFMPTQMTDRWQIEHYEDNYYIIHMASKPHESGPRYVLTAQPGEGSAGGSGITAPGNVFVTTLTANSTPSDSMLWQICADGMPMNIDSNDIAENKSYTLEENEKILFYYIPYRFNEDLSWQSSNISTVSHPSSQGIARAVAPGKSTISLIIDIDGRREYVTSQVYVKLPDGVYYLKSRSTSMLLDLDKDSISNGTSIQVFSVSQSEPDNFSQLYKFYYLENGLYSIRPMRKNNMGISWSSENQSATLQDIGTNNSSVPITGQWYLDKDANGYYLYAKTGKSKTITVPANAISSTDLVLQSYNGSTSQAWTISAATQNYSQIMLTDSFKDLNAQCEYSFDAWYVTSDVNINGDAVVSWDIEPSEKVIKRGETTNSFVTLIPGDAQLTFTVTHSGAQIDHVKDSEIDIKVEWTAPSEGDWFIRNAFTSKVVSTRGSNQVGATLSQEVFSDATINEWEFIHIDENYFYIVSKSSGLCIRANPNIAYAVMQSSMPVDPSDSDDYSIWKILRTSNNQFKIVCKAFENNGYVLSVVSETYGALILNTYTDDTDYRDEWHLNISGSELTILAVADNNITRSVAATNAESDAEEKGVDVNLIISRHTSTQAVLYGMKTSEVFVTRSHGSPNSIVIYSLEEGRESSSLKTSDIYDFDTETVQFDLSGCELVVFIGCSTAADANHHSIADAVVKAGAGSAIGFEETINAALADNWMEAFLQAYYDPESETYHNVAESMAHAVLVESDGGLDSCRLIP